MKEIKLTNSDKICLVDDEDYPVLSRITWSLTTQGYPRNRFFLMHRLLFGFPNRHKEVDHIDHNKLNNQKSNLRLTKKSGYTAGNNKNKNKSTTKVYTSQYKGVHWQKKDKIWITQIHTNNKTFHIGRFKEERHAAMAYDLWAISLYGQYAKTNLTTIAHS